MQLIAFDMIEKLHGRLHDSHFVVLVFTVTHNLTFKVLGLILWRLLRLCRRSFIIFYLVKLFDLEIRRWIFPVFGEV